MKILLLVPSLARSGPINGVYTLAAKLREAGVCPHLAALSAAPGDSLEDDFRALGGEVRILEGGRGNPVGALFALARVLKAERFDLVHSTCLRPDLCMAILRRDGSPRLISTVRSELYNDLKFSKGRVAAWLATGLHTWALGRLDRVVPHSAGIRAALTGLGVSPALMQVINNGVDTAAFRPPGPGEKSAARRALGIPEDCIVLGHVGHLSRLKGVSTILAAMAKLPDGLPVHFLSVGEGDQRQLLQNQAEELGIADRVQFAGRQSDVRPFLHAMDIFALPSRSEGLPRALIEACASGLPALVSDIPGCREVVVPGENGYLVEPGEAGGWAGALSVLVRSGELRHSMGAASRSRAENLFSARAMAGAYLELYRNLVTPSGGLPDDQRP